MEHRLFLRGGNDAEAAAAALTGLEMLPFRQEEVRFQHTVSRLGFFERWNRFGPADGCMLQNARLICA